MQAQRRTRDDAERTVNRYMASLPKSKQRANTITDQAHKLKVTFLGGLEDVGEKNMTVIEYGNDALVLDCGNNLGVDLPGVNYEINDTAYLESIRHKLRAYVITHGHLDHIGGLRHIVPRFPAPIYGSRYTIGVIEKSFEDESADPSFTPKLIMANVDSHEQLTIGCFSVEFIRVTHSIPDPSAVCITTPAGIVVATGDFRLDPEPLDNLPVDKARLQELGDQGVLLLLSESSYADSEGRTPTEHTLEQSFHDVITQVEGRIFVAVFSSNINRTQMIINAAVSAGRKVALDGRSMLAYVEIAVRQGILKVPQDTIVPMRAINSLPPEQVLVMCTGGQGEPNAALQRMSEGEHRQINLEKGDTVIISSSPIPGNEVRYDQISNRIARKGVHLFRHPTHELDGCGPLHVSGHARRDELREMIRLVRPKFLIPVHAGTLRRKYHADIGIEEGLPRHNVLLPENGDSFFFTADSVEAGGSVPQGGVLIDQTGSPISGLVVKDRLMLSEEGIMTVVLTVDKRTGHLLTSPDIISRGFIVMKDNEQLMAEFRSELKRAVQQRFTRIDLDRFKAELKDFIAHFLFEHTGRAPIVIPVVNVIGGKEGAKTVHAVANGDLAKTAAEQQRRFQEMRARLLSQDQRD
jgi:ribonuclease J